MTSEVTVVQGRSRTHGVRVMTLGLTTLVALAACSGSDNNRSPVQASAEPATTPPTTSAPPTTPATAATSEPTAAGSAASEPDVGAELQAAIDAYDAAYTAATAAPGEPDHPALLDATTDGELRRNVQATIGAWRDEGRALRPGATGVVLDQSIDEVLSVDGSQAVVRTCYFDAAELYDVATGAIVNDEQLAGHNQLRVVLDGDGRWRIDAGGPLGDEVAVEANPCG